jgi:hypothetical protein
MKFLICNFPQHAIISALLGPNIFISTMSSNTTSVCSLLGVRDQVSHPLKVTGKITVYVFKQQERRQ